MSSGTWAAGESDGNAMYWAYCRVSTRKQEQDQSLADQILWAETFARSRGRDLRIFIERHTAKDVRGRRVFQAMLSELRDLSQLERPELLLFTALDRLTRADLLENGHLGFELQELGINLYERSHADVMDLTSPEGQLSYLLKGIGGSSERHARSERTRSFFRRQRESGRPTTNRPPWGLQYRGGVFIEAANESAQWVVKAFEWYASGIGMPTIARRFSEGAPNHRYATSEVDAAGNIVYRERTVAWEPNRIKKMLSMQYYRGVLVSESAFDEVQMLIATKPRWSNTRKSEYPLSGSIKCKCGRAFHGHTTGGVTRKQLVDGTIRHYPNAKRIRSYQCAVCRYGINAERLEGWFRADLATLTGEPELLAKWIRASPKAIDMGKTRERLAQMEKDVSADELGDRRRRMWAIATESKHGSRFLDEAIEQLEREVHEKIAEIERLREVLRDQSRSARNIDRAQKLLAEFWNLFDAGTYEQKRNLAFSITEALGGAYATKAGIVWRQSA